MIKMINKNIIKFAESAIIIIVYDILELDIIIPKIIFDWDNNPNINNGYYMYQNISGDTITLNMSCINSLKNENDIKTVIVYGFIHEIIHMYQAIISEYKSNREYYTFIEDSADYNTISIIRDNLELINSRLNFKFNDVFLLGIERQLSIPNIEPILFNNNDYFIKTISGSLVSKLNMNFDYIFNLLKNSYMLTIIFPNKRNYNIDLLYGTIEELNILINLIYLTNFNIIHISSYDDFQKRLIVKLV